MPFALAFIKTQRPKVVRRRVVRHANNRRHRLIRTMHSIYMFRRRQRQRPQPRHTAIYRIRQRLVRHHRQRRLVSTIKTKCRLTSINTNSQNHKTPIITRRLDRIRIHRIKASIRRISHKRHRTRKIPRFNRRVRSMFKRQRRQIWPRSSRQIHRIHRTPNQLARTRTNRQFRRISRCRQQ